MTPTDLIVLDKCLATLPQMKVALHSPCDEQIDCFYKYFSDVTITGRYGWDILNESEIRTELLYLGNVMMYINNPRLAIRNLRKSCIRLLIQDVIYRDRSGHGTEFCNDGDCMRYSFGGDRARVTNAFDLNYLNPVYYQSYMDVNFDAKHFIMMI
jgi:hypothetical protein